MNTSLSTEIGGPGFQKLSLILLALMFSMYVVLANCPNPSWPPMTISVELSRKTAQCPFDIAGNEASSINIAPPSLDRRVLFV